jgi:hypothetical protein
MSANKLNGLTVALIVSAILVPSTAIAHCDAVDGPVVTLATSALDEGNINLVLPWVPKDGEPEIRRVFEQTLSVRKLGTEAQHLADTFFFETLVRVHRASEGAPYTGLKPAGLDLGPAIPAADKALDIGSTEVVEDLLIEAVRKGLHEHFRDVVSRKTFDPNDVAAGRRYVEAYVPYIHYVERLWEAAGKSSHGHHTEPTAQIH